MTMETKNSYIKRMAQLGNFKLFPLFVVQRHQKLMFAFINSSEILRGISSPCSDFCFIKLVIILSVLGE